MNRRAPVAQEQQHHENRKDRALDQRVQSRLVVSVSVEDRVVDRRNQHVRVLARIFSSWALTVSGNAHLAGALGAGNTEKVTTCSPLKREKDRSSS